MGKKFLAGAAKRLLSLLVTYVSHTARKASVVKVALVLIELQTKEFIFPNR